jgi:hypothetical protein
MPSAHAPRFSLAAPSGGGSNAVDPLPRPPRPSWKPAGRRGVSREDRIMTVELSVATPEDVVAELERRGCAVALVLANVPAQDYAPFPDAPRAAA